MIRGTKRPMGPTAKQTLDLRASIHNRFDIEVRDAATGELKQKAQAFNLICEALWDRLLATGSNNAWSPQGYFDSICFGSGSGTPSASDTTLFTRLGSKSASNFTLHDGVDQIAAGLVYAQANIRLNAEEYVGDTLTEVGIGYDGTHIVTHALLQDMNGNPISIEKTATDVIDIYATVYVHFPAGGWYNGSVTVSESDMPQAHFFTIFTGRTSATGAVMYCANASKRTGEKGNNIYASMNPVVNRSNKTVSMAARLAAGDFNIPIRAILIESFHYYYGSNFGSPAFWLTMGGWFTPPAISGEAVGTGDGTTTGFATAFPVKTAGTVYVDGVAATGVTMRTGPADTTNLDIWLNSCYKTAAGTPGYYPSVSTYYGGPISMGVAAGEKSRILENPFHVLGIAEMQCRIGGGTGTFKILASDDLVNWSETSELAITGYFATYQIPQALRNKRFWALQNTNTGGVDFYVTVSAGNAPDVSHNIVFETPPAAGAVITADYTPDCIAKDENHVFDLTLTLTFGEYSEV